MLAEGYLAADSGGASGAAGTSGATTFLSETSVMLDTPWSLGYSSVTNLDSSGFAGLVGGGHGIFLL